jgi:hypothetical protein
MVKPIVESMAGVLVRMKHASMMLTEELTAEFILDKVPDAGGSGNALLFSADKGPNERGVVTPGVITPLSIRPISVL